MADAAVKMALTILVLVLAIPGLVIEPGPVSEIVALSIIVGIWLDGGEE